MTDQTRGPAFSAELLLPGNVRDEARTAHPLITGFAGLPTPAVRTAFSVTHRTVQYGLPGAVLVGPPRMGKTLAILMLSRMLNETFPTLAVGKVVATTKGQPSPARFFGDIAESQRLPFTTIREPVKARNRVINSILLECEQKGGKRYLMLADEVQEWQEEEWSYLKDLGNLLAVQGVKLSVVGFAQTQLHAVRAKLLGRKDLLARFFKSIYNLGGLKGREDLEQVLQNMDDSRFDHPVRTGIPWSEFFMPKAYRSGWRLATEANELWAAFDHIHRNTVRTPVSEVLMSAVTLAVLSFFEGSEPEDSPNFHGTSTSWLDALARSNYAQDLGIAV